MPFGLASPACRFALALAACASWLTASQPAAAQTPDTDCGCSLTGDYVAPDPGVEPPLASAATGLSPSGRYRIDITSLPGQTPATLDVVRVADNTVLLHNATGLQWGFSPDDDRFVIGFFTGTTPNQQFEYSLYDLTGGTPAPKIWSNGPSPWNSARLRFSKDGKVFLFAGYHPTPGVHLALLEVASRSLYETSFFPSTAPGNVDDDNDPSVAGWGFGPDPTRFVYAYVSNSGAGVAQWGRVNVDTRVAREDTYTADSMFAVFSPCGDTIAFVVKQLALSDITNVYLFGTRNPLAAQLGTQSLPHSALQVQSTSTQHEVLQAGVPNVLAPNHAGDVCPVANVPPVAAFDAPAGLVSGSSGAFTDRSTDSDGHVVSWQWDFGDGTSSTSQSPSHAYSAPGTYTVRLTVTDDGGATDFTEEQVTVCGSLASLSGRVLFTDSSIGQDLWVLNADDGSRVRLTNQADSFSQITNARFSPDGTQIAYTDTGTFLAGIWVMNADGSHRHRLTDGGGPHGDFEFHDWPAWSPDGRWIAYYDTDVVTPANQGIWMMRADGSAAAKVPNTALRDFTPTFAPEIGCPGDPAARDPGCYTIVFNRDPGVDAQGNFQGRLASIAGDGSGLTFLTGAGLWFTPRISPDGLQLAYTQGIGFGGPIGGIARIYTVPRAGGPAQQITSGGDDNFSNPVWSAASDTIAYAFSVNGIPGRITDRDIGVSDGTGCSTRVLLSGPGFQVPMDWASGHASQGLGSIEGQVRLDSSYLATVAGAVVEMSGDATGTTTTDASGSFRFDDIPIGANVTIRFVSAPGYIAYPYATTTITGLVGHAIAVEVTASQATASVSGMVRDASQQAIEGATLTAEGPGGPFTAVTSAAGTYAMSVQHFASYVLTPSKPGFRFDPPSVTDAIGLGVFDFTAIPIPPPGRIAFVTSRGGDDDIWAADADGGNAALLIGGAGSQRDPAWSPDGGRIAYVSDDGSGPELWIYDVADDDAQDLSVQGREPAWSPDGNELVFASDSGLQRIALSDGTVTSLTSDPSDASPAWRPDGGAIVFERTVQDGSTDLYQVATVAGATPTLFVGFPGDDRDPAFAPAGDGFAYATQAGGFQVFQVYTQWNDAQQYPEGEHPTWSQDGTQIAFDTNGQIDRFDPRTDTFEMISSSGSDRDPSWQPSGVPACSNGIDDDGDGYVDMDDPGCTSPDDPNEHADTPGCDDGIDNDGDGLVDMQDPGCPVPQAPYEDPQCDNGIDDDGDGLVDFADPKCTAAWPYWEAPPHCGLGAELVLVIGLLRWRWLRGEEQR